MPSPAWSEPHPGQQVVGPALARRRAADAPPKRQDRGQHEDREPAVDELDRRRVAGEVRGPGRDRERLGRDQAAAHQGEGRVDVTGIEPGREGAPDRSQRDAGDDQAEMRAVRPARRALVRQAERQPEEKAVDREREHEMRGEPVMAHVGPVDQPALHHVPAERALRGAEQKGDAECETEPAADPSAQRKPDRRDGEDQPDEAAPEPVQIFQPEDRAEVLDRHPEIDPPELRRLAVEGERGLPPGGVERRQPAGHRPPGRHREPGAGEPGEPAQHHHREDHRAAEIEPESDRAVGLAGGHRAARGAQSLMWRALAPRSIAAAARRSMGRPSASISSRRSSSCATLPSATTISQATA